MGKGHLWFVLGAEPRLNICSGVRVSPDFKQDLEYVGTFPDEAEWSRLVPEHDADTLAVYFEGPMAVHRTRVRHHLRNSCPMCFHEETWLVGELERDGQRFMVPLVRESDAAAGWREAAAMVEADSLEGGDFRRERRSMMRKDPLPFLG